MNKEYLNYLKSNAWRKKRQAFKESKLFKDGCYICEFPTVDIHHKSYKRFKNERISDLVALCRSCHNIVHKMVKEHDNISKYNFWSCVKKYKKQYLKLNPVGGLKRRA